MNLPRAICAKCNRACILKDTGINLAAYIKDGRVYYKVMADLHRCPECGAEVFTGFGEPVESFRKEFAAFPTTVDVKVE